MGRKSYVIAASAYFKKIMLTTTGTTGKGETYSRCFMIYCLNDVRAFVGQLLSLKMFQYITLA